MPNHRKSPSSSVEVYLGYITMPSELGASKIDGALIFTWEGVMDAIQTQRSPRQMAWVGPGRTAKEYSKTSPNKKEAKVWEEETRKALKDPLSQKKIHGDIDFHSTAVDYLDYVRDRYQLKTYSEKRLIIASFESFLGQNIQIGLIDEKQIIDYLSSVKNKISANAAQRPSKKPACFLELGC